MSRFFCYFQRKSAIKSILENANMTVDVEGQGAAEAKEVEKKKEEERKGELPGHGGAPYCKASERVEWILAALVRPCERHTPV